MVKIIVFSMAKSLFSRVNPLRMAPWRHLRRLFGKSALAEAATAQNACCAAAMMVLTFGQRRRGREKMKIEDMMYVIYSGWWFGTFFIFHIVYGIIIPYHPN